jgi:hypothetical protein
VLRSRGRFGLTPRCRRCSRNRSAKPRPHDPRAGKRLRRQTHRVDRSACHRRAHGTGTDTGDTDPQVPFGGRPNRLAREVSATGSWPIHSFWGRTQARLRHTLRDAHDSVRSHRSVPQPATTSARTRARSTVTSRTNLAYHGEATLHPAIHTWLASRVTCATIPCE